MAGVKHIVIPLVLAASVTTSLYFWPQPTEPLFGNALLIQSLEGKTAKERANIKGDAIANTNFSGSYQNDTYNLDIQVISISKIDGGVQVLAKAWRDGQQFGFVDGTVEIERFNINNPPILVPDVAGTYTIDSYNPATDQMETRRFRIAPLDAAKDALAHAIHVSGRISNTIVPGKIGNTTDTFYPSPGTTEDGIMRRGVDVNQTWANIRSGAGTSAINSACGPNVLGDTSSNQWDVLDRCGYIFDTSGIADANEISAATLSLYGVSLTNGVTGMSTNLVSFSPASDSSFVASDYGNFGTTKFASDTVVSGWTTAAYNDFTLNASGIANVSKTGNSKFGWRFTEDIDNSSPTWVSGAQTLTLARDAATAGTTEDPLLTVTHAPAAAVSSAVPTTKINNGAIKINNGAFIVK